MGRLFQDIKRVAGREILHNHYIIHHKNLCAKRLSLPHVTVPIIKLINFIKLSALNHREFKKFLEELETEYGDLVFNTKVSWLSRGAMLKRLYNLRSEIQLFLEMNRYAFPHFSNKEWVSDFGFHIDMTQHLNDLNVELQSKEPFIHNLYNKIQGFGRKN